MITLKSLGTVHPFSYIRRKVFIMDHYDSTKKNVRDFACRIPQGHTSKDYKKRRIQLKPAEGLLPEEKGSIWTKTSDKLPPEGETVVVLCNDKFHPRNILYASFDRSQQMWTSGETTTFQFTSKHGQYWCPVSVFEV